MPADFHSLNITTVYYNFERAFSFFNRVAVLKADQLGTPMVYYWVDYQEEGVTMYDNAAFMPLVQGFLIAPYNELNTIPFSINGGIIGHEYSHFVLNYRVHGKSPIPQIPTAWESASGATPAANLLTGLDEGQADVFGTGITCDDKFENCDVEFMGQSLPDPYLKLRRVDGLHCMTDALDKAIHENSFSEFVGGCLLEGINMGCNYELATVFSSAMWRASQDADLVNKLGASESRKQMFQALWNAEGGGDSSVALKSWRDLIDEAGLEQSLFTLESPGGKPGVLDAVIDGASEPLLKKALCSAFMDRFNLDQSQIVHCPATAQSYKECVR